MTMPQRPRLRSTIQATLDPDDLDFILLYDASRMTRNIFRVRREAALLLELFDGTRTLDEMVAWVAEQGDDSPLVSTYLTELTSKLEQSLFLESPHLKSVFSQFLASPVREPSCVGSYPGDPEALERLLNSLFDAPTGSGRINPFSTPDGRLRAALIPHIDYGRGGTTYTWGFKEVVERSDADLFVILATSHYSRHRFILTAKDFKTPLGVARTDQAFVQSIADVYGPEVYDDEIAHIPEHSIELHVVFLQHVLRDRPFRIVPLLVGSFHDTIAHQHQPEEKADIYLMIQALKKAEAQATARGDKLCYLISGDLAHIGPKFSDPRPVDDPWLAASKERDHALLERLAAVDRVGFFKSLLAERDERRICGFPPAYMALAVAEPRSAKVLAYDQYAERQHGNESVSFASVAFYR